MAQKMRPDGTPYNILEQNLKRLGLTMLIFSIVDLVLAALLLTWPSSFVQALGITERAPWQFLALVHLLLPCFCVLAWMDPKRNIVIVTGAIMARVIYAVYVLVWMLLTGQGVAAGIALAVLSLIFAVIHYILLRLSDFGFWEILSRAGNPPGVKRW